MLVKKSVGLQYTVILHSASSYVVGSTFESFEEASGAISEYFDLDNGEWVKNVDKLAIQDLVYTLYTNTVMEVNTDTITLVEIWEKSPNQLNLYNL